MKKLSTLVLMLLSLTIGIQATQTTYEMVADDYQTIVDSVKNNSEWSSYVDSYETAESYFGASAYRKNFDIAQDGSWEKEVFTTWEDAVQTALSEVFLPKKYPSATTADTITVKFATWDGSSAESDSLIFYCSKATPDPEFSWIFEVVDLVADDYQTIVDSVKNSTEWSSYYNEEDNNESYFGTSADYHNFDIRDSKWNSDVFTSWVDAVQASISGILLPKKFPEAIEGEFYKVRFETYSGTTENDSLLFRCTVSGPTPEFEVSLSLSTEAYITSFKIDGQVGDAEIDEENFTISVSVLTGTDIDSVKPDIEISYGATISDTTIGYNFNSPVTYTVTAEDGTTTHDWVVTVSITELEQTSIYDIQYVTGDDLSGDNGDSPIKDSVILIRGVITGTITGESNSSYYNKIFVQNESGQWNCIYVYVKNVKQTDRRSKCDSIEVVGQVDEYYGLTEIDASSITTIDTRKSLPEAYEVTGALDESLEGVYVTMSGVTLETDSDETDYASLLFLVADLDGTSIKISSELLSEDDDILPDASKTYSIKGIVTYSRSHYRICPRSSSDVEEVSTSAVKELTLNNATAKVYPNPATSVINIEGFEGTISIINLLGQTVKVIDDAQDQINISDLESGIYYVKGANQGIRILKE